MLRSLGSAAFVLPFVTSFLALTACGDDSGSGGAGGESATNASASTTSASGPSTNGTPASSSGSGDGGAPTTSASSTSNGAGGDGSGGEAEGTGTGGAGGDGTGGEAEGTGTGGSGGDGSGGDATGTGGGGTGGGGTGGFDGIAACEEWRDAYGEISEALGCAESEVDDPDYCDQWADNECLPEIGAYYACSTPYFVEDGCTCTEDAEGPTVDCIEDCEDERTALVTCIVG